MSVLKSTAAHTPPGCSACTMLRSRYLHPRVGWPIANKSASWHWQHSHAVFAERVHSLAANSVPVCFRYEHDAVACGKVGDLEKGSKYEETKLKQYENRPAACSGCCGERGARLFCKRRLVLLQMRRRLLGSSISSSSRDEGTRRGFSANVLPNATGGCGGGGGECCRNIDVVIALRRTGRVNESGLAVGLALHTSSSL